MGYDIAMCWKCGKAITVPAPVARSAVCPSCGADARSCKNCRFWSPGGYHDCAERVDDAVSDKERANFCDSFQFNPAFRSDHAPLGAKPSGKAAFDALFN